MISSGPALIPSEWGGGEGLVEKSGAGGRVLLGEILGRKVRRGGDDFGCKACKYMQFG